MKFAEFSAGPVFRTDGLQRPNLGELADAAIRAHRKGEPLSHHHQLTLKDIARIGSTGEVVANFILAIASGESTPNIPKSLPKIMQRYLQELEFASRGTAKFVQLVPTTVEAVCMRLTGTPLSQKANELLAELRELGKDGQTASEFLRDLAEGKTPSLPKTMSNGMRPFLKDALAWVVQRKVPAGLVRHVSEDCLKARHGYGDLDEDALRALAALEATGGVWPQVAHFLREIAAGETPEIPADAPEPIRSDLLSVRQSSHWAGVQQPRTLEIISIGFGDPATGIDLFSLVRALLTLRGHTTDLPDDIAEAIQKFEEGAPERLAVAQNLRALVTGAALTPPPDKLPIAVRLAFVQIEAMANGGPIPLDPLLIGLAAIRTRHGGGPMGGCIMLSLQAMTRATAESKILATYLWNIANGGPAGPAPIMTEPQMAATAEEVRCLADKEVGGIRMMMRQAEP